MPVVKKFGYLEKIGHNEYIFRFSPSGQTNEKTFHSTKYPNSEIDKLCELIAFSENEPHRFSWFTFSDMKWLWLYKNVFYKVYGPYSDEQIKLMILDDFDRERRKFERLKKTYLSDEDKELSKSRPRIPETVRIQVWRRDGGKCARCGSRENLEYDHIVPLSKGGSNTARNIELLCESCNRSKGSKIG